MAAHSISSSDIRKPNQTKVMKSRRLFLFILLVNLAGIAYDELRIVSSRHLQGSFCDFDTILEVFESIVAEGTEEEVERISCTAALNENLTGQFPQDLPLLSNLEVL